MQTEFGSAVSSVKDATPLLSVCWTVLWFIAEYYKVEI